MSRINVVNAPTRQTQLNKNYVKLSFVIEVISWYQYFFECLLSYVIIWLIWSFSLCTRTENLGYIITKTPCTNLFRSCHLCSHRHRCNCIGSPYRCKYHHSDIGSWNNRQYLEHIEKFSVCILFRIIFHIAIRNIIV